MSQFGQEEEVRNWLYYSPREMENASPDEDSPSISYNASDQKWAQIEAPPKVFPFMSFSTNGGDRSNFRWLNLKEEDIMEEDTCLNLPSSRLHPKLLEEKKPRRNRVYSQKEFFESGSDEKPRRKKTATWLYTEIRRIKRTGGHISHIIEEIRQVLVDGITMEDRWEFWLSVAEIKVKMRKEPKVVERLARQECSSLDIIEKDAERTYLSSDNKDKLVWVLRACAVSSHGGGYTQGMNFIVSSLLENFTEDQTFWLVDALLNQFMLKGLFQDDLPLLNLFTF